MTALAFRTVAIIGGGCYGTFYAGQLRQAMVRGKIRIDLLLIVDRDPGCQAARELDPGPGPDLVVADWGEFLDQFLDQPPPEAGAPDDAVVPSPLMPHLMLQWLARGAKRSWPDRAISFVPAETSAGTPYDRMGQDGNRYVSFADWLCPVHCVEPHVCPVIRGPRTWEMADAAEAYVARLDRDHPTRGPALFVTRHRAFGVGMFDAAEARAARTMLEAAAGEGGEVDLLVGTVSSCHGALGLLRLAPAPVTYI
jgi:hypothetical protein